MKRFLTTASLCALAALIPGPENAWSDLAHGTTNLAGYGFDFSTQTSYPPPVTDYPNDISFAIVVEPPLGPRLVMWSGSSILTVPDTLVEDITTAPTDASVYHYDEFPVVGRAYVVKTGDGFFVKFALRGWQPGGVIIEYFVQMDGTNNLADEIIVAVTPTTWGRVKALYR